MNMDALTRTGSTLTHKCPTTVQNTHDLEEKKLDVLERRDERTWRSCCIETDKRACVFGVQTVIAISSLMFSGFMLVRYNGECDTSSPYINIITFILGSFVRDTGINKK